MLTIITAVATSAGPLAPYVMGRIIESGATPTEGFYRGFLICGVVSLIGGFAGMAFLRPELTPRSLLPPTRLQHEIA